MKGTYDAVDIFTASSLAIIGSSIIFIKSLSWSNEGGIRMVDLTGIFNGTVLRAIAGIGILLVLVIYMWRQGKNCTDPNWWNHPLGLPTGSVRALIAILFIAMIAITDGNEEWLVGIIGTIIGFYFGERKSSGGEEDVMAAKFNEILKISGLTPEQRMEIEKIRDSENS